MSIQQPVSAHELLDDYTDEAVVENFDDPSMVDSPSNELPVPSDSIIPDDTDVTSQPIKPAQSASTGMMIAIVTVMSAIFIPFGLAIIGAVAWQWSLVSLATVSLVLYSYVLVKRSVRVPEGTVIAPTKGPWLAYSRFMKRRRGDEWSTNYVSKADYASHRQTLEASDRQEYIQLLIAAIKAETQQIGFSCLIANLKGGSGKTPLSALIANVLRKVTGRVVTAVDNNPFGGTLYKWLGVDRLGTNTIRGLHKDVESRKVKTFRDFSDCLGFNDLGVQFLASDRVADRHTYGKTVAMNVGTAAKQNSNFVVNDTSNDISNGAFEAVLELSAVMVVAGLCVPDKLDGVNETIDILNSWGYDEETRHAITVVLGLKPGDSAENYREQMGLSPEAILLGNPEDEHLKSFQAIDLDQLSEESWIAALEVTLAVCLVARHKLINPDKNKHPLELIQGQLVPLSSGRTPVLSYLGHAA